jgi:VIT1/CCC1 family predicted Fe2+/Mn2+ transporter
MKKHEPTVEGIAFGVMSGVMTILGVLIGLSATGVKEIAGFGILIVGVADAFSDAAGMYVSEESEGVHKQKGLIKSAVGTFTGKLTMLAVLLIPVLLLDLWTGVITSFTIGFVIVAGLGIYIGRDKSLKEKSVLAVKYALIAAGVAVISYFVGSLAQNLFMF